MAVQGALTGPLISRHKEGAERCAVEWSSVDEDRCAFISALAAVNAARLKGGQTVLG